MARSSAPSTFILVLLSILAWESRSLIGEDGLCTLFVYLPLTYE